MQAAFVEITCPLIFIFIFLLIKLKPGKKRFKTYGFLLFAAPSTVLLMIINTPAISDWLAVPSNTLVPIIVFLLLNLYLLKGEKGANSFIFWAILLMAVGEISTEFTADALTVFIKPAMLLFSYILFLCYFYRQFALNLLAKVFETEKQLNMINRSIENEVKKRVVEIERVNRKLLDMSKIDPLTKVFNKSAVLDAIENSITTKPEIEFSILMFDIDDFKKVNDTLGHTAGDKCLKSLTVTARNNLREFDIVGRYGGDEFIILLPGTNLNHAFLIAERFRKAVSLSESPHYTVSIGISTYPDDGLTVKELVEIADDNLYVSKGKGRNAVSYRNVY